MLAGQLITLQPYTLERCHAFWQNYIADPAMWSEDFTYNKQTIDQYYKNKVMDPTRIFFAICHHETTIGEIQLKRINLAQRHATLSIHLCSDRYKNRGWGSEAIKLLTSYAFAELGLKTIYADAIHRNTRSQHVLQKTGFTFTHADDVLRYYSLHNTTHCQKEK